MARRPRRNHSSAFKAKVALEALRGIKTLTELATQYDVPLDLLDVSYKLADAERHIEIKPNTASGMRSFNQQVARWAKGGIDPNTVKAMTYDAQSNLRWGFHF